MKKGTKIGWLLIAISIVFSLWVVWMMRIPMS